MIQYKYSLTDLNEIVEISQLKMDERSKNFYCLGCGKQLIPKMGPVKEWHFAHKVQINCSQETYLHRLGKEIFVKEYMECLSNNKPFVLEVPKEIECNKCLDDFNVRCSGGNEIENFDLTKHFNVLEMEKNEGGFRPDILLSSSKTNRKIYVEIAVTHSVEQEKIDLGEVIVEYTLRTEEDIQLIKSRKITSRNQQVHLYNLHPKIRINKDLSKTDFCNKKKRYFLIFKSGKSIIKEIPLPEVKKQLIHNSVVNYIELDLDEDGIEAYKRNIIYSFEHGAKIKNCFLCRYHAKNDYRSNIDFTIFCKFLKQGNDSNYAVECEYFRADSKAYSEYL